MLFPYGLNSCPRAPSSPTRMTSIPGLPDDVALLLSGIKSHFDDDRCLHARDDLVKCRALAAAAGCSEALEEYVKADADMCVIAEHIHMLNEALDLVRSDSAGALIMP